MSTPAAKMSDERASASAVRYPPYDPPHAPMRDGVHVRARAQVQPRAQHIVVLASARGAVVERLAEVESVADAAPIVHREHHVSPAREILVHRVRVAVVVHVVPAEQHLPARAAVEEDDGGMPLALAPPGGRKSCPWSSMPSPDGKITCCGVDERARGEVAGMSSGAMSRGAAEPATIAGRAGQLRIGAQERDGLPVARLHGRPLDARAARHRDRLAARRAHAPDVPPVDVALVG